MTETHTAVEIEGAVQLSVVIDCPDGGGRHPCALLLHGLGGHKDNDIHLMLVSKLHELGIASVRFDFPGCGDSGGTTRNLTVGNAAAALQAVTRLAGVHRQLSKSQLGAVGASFGGAVLLRAARHIENLRAMVLRSPVSDYVAVRTAQLGPQGLSDWERSGVSDVASASGRYPTPFEFFLDAQTHDAYAEASRTKVPLLIVQGGADATVPVQHSERLQAAWGGEADLVVFASADHSMSDANSMRRFVLLASDFLQSNLVEREGDER